MSNQGDSRLGFAQNPDMQTAHAAQARIDAAVRSTGLRGVMEVKGASYVFTFEYEGVRYDHMGTIKTVHRSDDDGLTLQVVETQEKCGRITSLKWEAGKWHLVVRSKGGDKGGKHGRSIDFYQGALLIL